MRKNGETYISIKLPNEAGEIIMLEVFRKQFPREFQRIQHHKAQITRTPRNDAVCRGIIYHVVSLRQKRRQGIGIALRAIHL